MDRFEVSTDMKESFSKVDLHSSMDRFEVLTVLIFEIPKYVIYIPVWIDLKTKTTAGTRYVPLHLHSSMDRFEANIIRTY